MRQLRLIISPVPDWAVTRTWYRDVLGLVEFDGWDAGEGDRGSFLAVGPAEIEVMEASITGFTPLPDSGGRPALTIALRVDDLDREWRRLLGHGVHVLQPPTDRPWGSRDFIVTDPNGVPILLFQHDSG
jgi:uncharacterized glyoxalase superfamily protein PhnB